MKVAVIVFPGSNCDRDVKVAINKLGGQASFVWHRETDLKGFDLIVLPGGFSYGDLEGPGCLASESEIMSAVKKEAKRGVKILGICNGFQILITSKLLPGKLALNETSRFVCKNVTLYPMNIHTGFTSNYKYYQKIVMPVAHHSGRYDVSFDDYRKLQDQEQIAFTYADNPNGSMCNIAGVFNSKKNILGMMPHPERAYESECGCLGGLPLFESLLK